MSGNAKGPKGGLGAFAYKPGAPKPFKATRPKQPSLGNPLADTLAERLARGRAIVSRGIVDRDTKRDLMKNGGWKGPKLINGKPIVDVNKLTHDPPELQPTLATKVGQLGTSSIIGNPFPHGFKNVGDLTYLAGGARTGTGRLGRRRMTRCCWMWTMGRSRWCRRRISGCITGRVWR